MSCAAQSSISIKQTNFCASLSLSVDRALELYYDVAVKISPTLVETSWHITAKQQNINLELHSLS